MLYLYIALGIIALLVLVFLFLRFTPVCMGGELFSGCGKPLYFWRKKIKLPSGRYCCTACYARDLEQYAKMRVDVPDSKLVFTEEEEMEGFDFGDTDSTDKQN